MKKIDFFQKKLEKIRNEINVPLSKLEMIVEKKDNLLSAKIMSKNDPTKLIEIRLREGEDDIIEGEMIGYTVTNHSFGDPKETLLKFLDAVKNF